jgi:hypothetical protein
MDLSVFDTQEKAESGVEMVLENPMTGEPLMDKNGKPVTITLLGVDSWPYQEHAKAIQAKRVQRMVHSKAGGDTDAEEMALLAACTVGWSGIVLDGQELKFSEGAARDLYQRFPWIKDQVDRFIGDRSNFFAGA